jgi:hypothetical protein
LNAVFFVLGECLELPANHAILERMAQEGHFIGNHGYSHQMLTHLTDDQIRSGFRRTEALIGNLDRGVKLWRPPFSDRDQRVDSILASLGYTRMLWNVDALDWMNPAPAVSWVDQTLEQIRSRRARGFFNTVCVMHDTLPATVAQCGLLLDRLDELSGTSVASYNPWHVDGLSVGERVTQTKVSSPLLCPADVFSFHLGDARVLARAQINAVYILNESAGLVWEALAARASQGEAAQTLACQYDISEDQAAQDVQSVIDNWRCGGLLGPKAVELDVPNPWVRSLREVGPGGAPWEEVGLGAPDGQVAEEHSYSLLDFRFRIRFQTVDLARAIHPRYANLETPAGGASESVFQVAATSGDYVLGLPDAVADAGVDAVATIHSSPAGLAYELFFEIMKLAYPDLSLMACLHSSLIGWGDGAVALIGNNGSGKSTLAAALHSCERAVLGDDRLFLDFATGRPVATPNAIGLKRGSWQPLLSRYPNLLQLPVVRSPIPSNDEEVRFLLPPPPTQRLLPPIQHVFFPRYNAAAATTALPLSPVQALERITAAQGWISADPEKLARFLQWLEGLQCYDLPYSSLDTAIAQMAECLPTGTGA